jgi:ribosomal protein L25 (general stress protein Ctc)
MYELMKHIQQYARNDIKPYGTFLMDWTTERDVALYFSTYDGKGQTRRLRSSAGAIWVFYPAATGNVLMTRKLREILAMMKDEDFRLRAKKTLPLIFHPSKQTAMPRAMAQKPVYVAQIDFRYDLADIWTGTENKNRCCVFKKIILSESVLPDMVKHLEKNGIDERQVYPD